MSVILLSGGLDSAVLLAKLSSEGDRTLCLAFDYGQKHAVKELWCAYQLAHYYGREFYRQTIDPRILAGSALTSDFVPIPHGHFEDPIQSATVVPNRNMVLLSLAGAFAARHGRKKVLFAVHAGDAAIYSDCRMSFVDAVSEAMRLGCGVSVEAPFLGMAKRDIVRLGRELTVPMDMTWSCYGGGDVPCGKCGACVERDGAML